MLLSNLFQVVNCLIDSILLALQEQKQIKPLKVDDRAAVCSSVRRNLIEHHGVAPESPEEGQAYLSHEGSFHDICTRLRIDHPDIWFEDIDPHRLRLFLALLILDRLPALRQHEDVLWSMPVLASSLCMDALPVSMLTQVCK